MFNQFATEHNLSELLVSAQQFHPYPKASERDFWEKLPEAARSTWIGWAEERLDYTWPALPAVRYMDYVRNGNRTRYEEAYFERRRVLGDLLFGECVEGQGRFLEQIINGLWCICEESYWVIPAHMTLSTQSDGYSLPDITEQVIDLFAADTGGLLAWTAYLFEDKLQTESPMILKRIRYEMKRRIFEPYLERRDFWWMGYTPKRVNNWNPWIHSNCLAAFLILEEDASVRSRAVAKAMQSLDSFMGIYHPDGGCDEGPGYWGRAGASLFDCLELLYAGSEGHIDFYKEPLVQEMGKYIYRVHIAGNDFVNFADGDARLSLSADVVYRYGKRIDDSQMSTLGTYTFQANGITRDRIFSCARILGEFANYAELTEQQAEAPYERDVWLKDTHIFVAREQEGSSDGLYLAAKGGHNEESHNHNDVGHYIVYYNGHPFFIDAGTENYTAKTFSERRYEIWTMQSGYHSLPTVNGVEQQNGEAYRASDIAYVLTDAAASFSLNLAAAYPEAAGIELWRRSMALHRKEGEQAYVEIKDAFELNGVSTDLVFNCLTLPMPQLLEDGRIELANEHGERIWIQYEANRLEAAVETITVSDARMQSIWGDTLYRLQLRVLEPLQAGEVALKIAAADAGSAHVV
ncbi:Heparinase II/III-like protein [Paenibacillus sp. 1_12]|uniref:heparinase II/III domain-containing protein n=1 Tax=Paenibacillus sp. 1_12 TaxID=1566278 RepID=UPI0008E4D56A|nr:heparinase II/III family protein [Paenibacillus sp. 1_12]SFL76666.1 Heparinase II/III-like protein [Paenibacillus sp. 1_12]